MDKESEIAYVGGGKGKHLGDLPQEEPADVSFKKGDVGTRNAPTEKMYNVDGNEVVYDGALYHHPQFSGVKSKAPSNPSVIEQSIQIKADLQGRIAVDPVTEEVVVFYSSNNGKVHGFIKDPTILNVSEQNALRKLGYIKKGNKIKAINK
ncbi:MAG: hypothetical protein KA998_04290 [Rickettsiaceae bacterium]|nr:hypothetical protein [Rickettsiaceae bacterium]